jgi:microcin C transport system substrate-binding protein
VIVSHGYSTFGELKYPADFPHLDYVNPDAPKGGEISIWAQGTFDTFNPYSSQGRAASLSSIFTSRSSRGPPTRSAPPTACSARR